MKGVLQVRKPGGDWEDVMPFIGKKPHIAVSEVSRKLQSAVRVRPYDDPDSSPDEKEIS